MAQFEDKSQLTEVHDTAGALFGWLGKADEQGNHRVYYVQEDGEPHELGHADSVDAARGLLREYYRRQRRITQPGP